MQLLDNVIHCMRTKIFVIQHALKPHAQNLCLPSVLIKPRAARPFAFQTIGVFQLQQVTEEAAVNRHFHLSLPSQCYHENIILNTVFLIVSEQPKISCEVGHLLSVYGCSNRRRDGKGILDDPHPESVIKLS